MKAILVIDMPEKCVDCDLHQWVDIENYENDEIRCLMNRSKTFDADDDKPSWCPLRPLPSKEKVDEEIFIDYKAMNKGYQCGRNSVIEEITGETE